MPEIYQTKNFIVEAPEKPHITRTDGGHIRIFPRKKVIDRTKLSPRLATELMRLTIVVGEAMATAYPPNRNTGFYDGFEPLDDGDISEIKKEIEKIFRREKYSDKSWGL